jgi:adenylate cyclase
MLATRYSTIGIPLIPGVAGPATEKTTCATVLFADLRGYDTIVAQLPALKVVPLLEEFFAILTSAVLECGGQIFHLAGADMMAGFGVGDSRHTQIHEALTAARTIQQAFTRVRASWQEKHSVYAGVGIGIHRGEVAIGVFGTPERTALTNGRRRNHRNNALAASAAAPTAGTRRASRRLVCAGGSALEDAPLRRVRPRAPLVSEHHGCARCPQ